MIVVGARPRVFAGIGGVGPFGQVTINVIHTRDLLDQMIANLFCAKWRVPVKLDVDELRADPDMIESPRHNSEKLGAVFEGVVATKSRNPKLIGD